MILPSPYFVALAIALALAVMWWVSRRMKVAHPPVALLVTRVGFPPDMRIADVDGAVAMLELRDEIVIPFQRATLVIEFPLTNPAYVQVSSALPIGFTRAELVRTICEEYAHVYAAEEGTSVGAEVTVEDRGARRERNRTDGAYGIWGHDLDDLVLTAARWVKQSNGDVRIELHVVAKPRPAAGPPRPRLVE